MADINQVLGFDASQAITSLRGLSSELKTVSGDITNFASAAQNFNNQAGALKNTNRTLATFTKRLQAINAAQVGGLATGFTQAAAAANNAATATGRIGNAAQTASGSAQNLNLSLGSIGRLMASQVIVRGITAITSNLRESVSEAIKLGQAINRIQIIDPQKVVGNADQIFNSLTQFSEKFGLTIEDVASGLDTVLQSDVRGGAQNPFAVLEAGAKLAITTNSSLESSIGSIVSQLNSFGLSANESGRIAAELFKTIEIGSTKIPELESSIGRVAPVFAIAGGTTQEFNAALATITRSGTNTSTALTQILAVVNKMLKPSESLQQAFSSERLGFNSFEEGVQKFGGVLPALKAIFDATSDNAAVQAEAFNNVRAFAGIINLFGSDVRGVTDVIKDFANESDEAFNKKIDFVLGSEAQQAQIAMEGLNNAFTELGKELIPAATVGAKAFSSVVSGLIGVGQSLGGVFQRFADAWNGLKTGEWDKAIEAFTNTRFEDVTVEAEKMSAALNDASLKKLSADTKEYTQDTEEAAAALQKLSTAANQNSASITRAAKNLATTTTDAAITALDRLTKVRQDISKGLDDTFSGAADRVRDIKDELKSLETVQADTAFRNSIDFLTDAQKASQILAKASEQTSKGLGALGGAAGNEQQRKQALSDLEQAREYAIEARDLAQGQGNRSLEASATRQILEIDNKRVQALKAIGTQEQANAKAAGNTGNFITGGDTQEANIKVQTERIKNALKQLGTGFNSEDTIGRLRSEITDAAQQLAKEGFTKEQIEFAVKIGKGDEAKNFQQQLQNLPIQLNADIDGLIANLKSQAAATVIEIPVELRTQGAAILGEELSQTDPLGQFNRSIEKAKTELSSLRNETDAVAVANAQFANEQSVAMAGFQQILEGTVGSTEALASLKGLMKEVFTTDGVDTSKIAELQTFLIAQDKLHQKSREGPIPGNRTGFITGAVSGLGLTDEQIKSTDTLLENLKTKAEKRIEVDIGFPPGTEERIKTLENFLDVNSTKSVTLPDGQALSTNLGSAATASNTLKTNSGDMSSSLGTASTASADIATNMKAAATSAAQAAAASKQIKTGGGAAASKARGGPIYRAEGGFAPRGTDTVPAMLTPGEFVVNADSSKKFASELIAINAGSRPQAPQGGGSVTHSVSVGDIHVSGATDPEATARLVLSRIQRELRRGTSPKLR